MTCAQSAQLVVGPPLSEQRNLFAASVPPIWPHLLSLPTGHNNDVNNIDNNDDNGDGNASDIDDGETAIGYVAITVQ